MNQLAKTQHANGQQVALRQEQELQLHGGHSMDHAVALAAATLDKRLITARQFPRSITGFKQEALDLLQNDIETARSAEYSKPVGGGRVTGPSIRLMELLAMCWTNIELEINEPIVGQRSVTVQAMAWDLERNVRCPGIATMSIINKMGARYPQHMIETTILAASSKARRNALRAIIPNAYVQEMLEAARAVANKNQEPLEARRAKMLDYFARSYRVQESQVFEYLGVKGVADITSEHVDELRMVTTAIKEGEAVDAFFGKSKTKGDLVKEKMAARKAAEANDAPKEDAKTEPEPEAKKETPKVTKKKDKLQGYGEVFDEEEMIAIANASNSIDELDSLIQSLSKTFPDHEQHILEIFEVRRDEIKSDS